MGNSSFVVFLVLHILIRLRLSIAQTQLCSNRGTFSTNSTYHKNLNLLLSSLPSNTTANGGFYNATAGDDPDKVYSLALCRGDIASEECYKCINSTAQTMTEQCPNKKEAISWGERTICLLRYSNRDIFGSMEVEPSWAVSNPNNVSTDSEKFNQTLYNLVRSLVTQASSGSDDQKFATGVSGFTSSRNVYAMVQCTPDISQNACKVCLEGALDESIKCCGGKEGGRFLRPSCFVWFELFRFYESGSEVSISPTLPKPSPRNPDSLSPPSSTGTIL